MCVCVNAASIEVNSRSGPSAVCGEVHQPESLHELVDVDAAILVEVHALRQVCDGRITDFHLKMRAQEFPGLKELLERDQPWKRRFLN